MMEKGHTLHTRQEAKEEEEEKEDNAHIKNDGEGGDWNKE